MSKRVFDLLLVLIAAPVWLPSLLLISIAVLCVMGRPVLFSQVRPGLRGRSFRVLKFRTMSNAYDPSGVILPDYMRMTRFGKFLRSTSLDELPELWNVLRGEMSLVGPRPLLLEYLPLYTPDQARRHDVPPGITGWAQINGRNAISWDEKFALDLWYVDHSSVLLDCKILFVTFRRVLHRTGISAPNEPTMPKFLGKL